MSHCVKLFVYDISKGLARQLSQGLLGKLMGSFICLLYFGCFCYYWFTLFILCL